MTEAKKKITIPREKWLRGPYSDESVLLNEKGMRCCVGHILSQCGVSDDVLLNVHAAHELDELPESLTWMWIRKERGSFKHASSDGQTLYSTNDDEFYCKTDEQKEADIRAVCARHGLEVEFTGPRLPVVNEEEVRYEDAPSSD